MVPSSSLLQVLFLGLSWLTTQAVAQTSDAKCTLSNFTWATNSLGQDPCLMSAYARGACVGGPFTVPALQPEKVYIPNTPNMCECSEVVYSLVSACSACQNQTQYYTWQSWTLNCTSLYAGYPPGVPSGTAFPAWAYLDVTQNNTFNPIAARNRASANAAESTATYTATSKPLITGSTTSAAGFSTRGPICADCGYTSSAVNGGGDNGSGDNGGGSSGLSSGALAGVIVGPILGVALITAIVIFACMRQRQHHQQTNNMNNGFAPQPGPQMGQYENNTASPTTTNPMLPQNNSFAGTPYGSSYTNGHTPMKPYDPSDPSTFPTAAPPASIHTTPNNPNAAGGFRGIAEI